eukprot:352800-Chlamydomonas_euryale.AAC.19
MGVEPLRRSASHGTGMSSADAGSSNVGVDTTLHEQFESLHTLYNTLRGRFRDVEENLKRALANDSELQQDGTE